MDGMSTAAKTETIAAQARRIQSVVKETHNLASKIKLEKAIPLKTITIIHQFI